MRRALATLGLAFLLPACDFVTGSGTLVTEQREVAAFTKVSVADAVSAVVSEGPTSVRVTTDDNVVGFVDVAVQDGALVVGVRDSAVVSPSKGIEVRVYTPSLTALDASGAARVVAQAPAGAVDRFDVAASGASSVQLAGVQASTLTALGSGASDFTLSGAAGSLELALSGASTGCLSKLPSIAATVSLSGASSAQIAVSTSVSGDLSGASNLEVDGAPAERSVASSGGSNVTYR